MLHRHAITWPVAGDDAENIIGVSFVFESSHADEYAGQPRDGETSTVQIDAPQLADRLRGLEERGVLRWPSPERTAIFGDIFAAAESAHADLGTFAGAGLAPFTPAENLPSVHDIDPAHVSEHGVVDNAAAMNDRMRSMGEAELEAFLPLRDRAEALRLTLQQG